jgi:hypothetical protein
MPKMFSSSSGDCTSDKILLISHTKKITHLEKYREAEYKAAEYKAKLKNIYVYIWLSVYTRVSAKVFVGFMASLHCGNTTTDSSPRA